MEGRTQFAMLYVGDWKAGRMPWVMRGGSQALLIARPLLPVIFATWDEIPWQAGDLRMIRAGGKPHPLVHVHQPNLVQHRPVPSSFGLPYHSSITFDKEWKAA